jgi:hypothetical protein
MTRTWKIKEWDCDKQSFRPEEKVTLAEYRARVEGSKAAASAIFSSTK